MKKDFGNKLHAYVPDVPHVPQLGDTRPAATSTGDASQGSPTRVAAAVGDATP
jgi:hypothetical protein